MLALLLRLAPIRSLLLCCGLLCQCVAFGMTVEELPALGAGPVIRTPQGREQVLYQASHALLISASNYLGAGKQGWARLEHTPREMNAVAEVLRQHGFHVRRVSDPSSADLYSEIRQFMAMHAHSPLNRVVVFFSGHGYSENGMGYLVPVDAKLPSADPVGFRAKALPIDSLQTEARLAKAAHVLFLFDSCFSGSIVTSRGPGDLPTAASSERWRYLRDMINTPVRQFITAGGPNEKLPAKSHFASLFVKALSDGSGAQVNDGYLTGRELAQYLAVQVHRYNQHQMPHSGFVRDPDLEFGDMIFQLPGRSPAANPYGADLEGLKVRPGQPRSVRIKVDDPANLVTDISKNHTWVASITADEDADIHVHDAGTGKHVASVRLPDLPDENNVEFFAIRQIVFSPNDDYLYVRTETHRNKPSAQEEHRILLVSTRLWKVVRTLTAPTPPEHNAPEIIAIRNQLELVIQYGQATGWGRIYVVDHVEWEDRDHSEPVRSRRLLEGPTMMCRSADYAVYNTVKGQRDARGWETDFIELNLTTLSVSHFGKERFDSSKDNVAGLCNRKISQAVHERLTDLRMRMTVDRQGLVTLSPPGTRPVASASDNLPRNVTAVDDSGTLAMISVKQPVSESEKVQAPYGGWYSLALVDIPTGAIIWTKPVKHFWPQVGKILPSRSAVIEMVEGIDEERRSVEFLILPLSPA